MSQNIREWLRDHGHTVSDRGRIRAELVEEYNTAHANGGPLDEDEPFLIVPDDPAAETIAPVSPPEPPRTVEERKPEPPPRKRRGLRRDNPRAGKTPVKRVPRVSVAMIGGFIYSGIGYTLSRNPQNMPVARSMDIIAPVAGEIFDDAVKNTIVDRLLQPIARSGEKGEKIAALTAFPAMVALCTRRPELYPALKPAMRYALLLTVQVSREPMKRIQKQATELAEELDGFDPDAVIEGIFADMEMPTAASADEEAAVRRARGE